MDLYNHPPTVFIFELAIHLRVDGQRLFSSFGTLGRIFGLLAGQDSRGKGMSAGKHILALASGTLMVCGASMAHAHESDAHAQAELEIVQDGPRVSISLYSPLSQVLGFEHAARDEAEKSRVKAANAHLRAKSLFAFTPAALCQRSEVRVRSEVLNPHSHGHEHGHGADHHHRDASGHAKVKVIWEFECSEPEALKGIDVRLFRVFPRMTSLSTQALFATGQVDALLSARQMRVEAP
ncbi:MAG TPA: DUF2796 domain-containing protein [Limnobacter sp.]|nr:DUF2796 domain-containing protein [Limnobacter sp.]